MFRLMLARILPVVLVLAAAAAWFADVQGGTVYLWRNLVPLAVLLVLASITLWLGDGSWTGAGRRWVLGTLGFTIPALGLSLYLHYAYSVNLNDMFGGAEEPLRVFRYLPWYTTVAGAIGFAIGWIVGRNM